VELVGRAGFAIPPLQVVRLELHLTAFSNWLCFGTTGLKSPLRSISTNSAFLPGADRADLAAVLTNALISEW
jgi:hypothetical protein